MLDVENGEPRSVSSKRSRIVAIVPSFNSAQTIERTVEALLGEDAIDRVVVVDDGSRDDTATLAALAGATVVQLRINHGKAAAIERGIMEASQADIYVLVDADTKRTASQVLHLVPPLLRDECDLAIGILPHAGKRGGFGFVKRLAAFGIRAACGYRSDAPLSGQRAIRGTLLRDMNFATRFGFEVGMTIDAVRRGARVAEYSVDIEHAHTGRSWRGFLHRARQGRDIFEALWARLVPRLARVALLGALLCVACAALLLRGQEYRAVSGERLPHVQHATVVAVPYWSYDDFTYNADGMPSNTGVPSLNRRLDNAESWIVGNVATGSVKDAIGVLDGSKLQKTKKTDESQVEPASPVVKVMTERVANNIEDIRASQRLNERLDGPVVYVGVNVYGKEQRLRPIVFTGFEKGGTLRSGATHREGIVDIGDIAPTVLSLQGLRAPRSPSHEPLRFVHERFSFAQLSSADAAVQFYNTFQRVFVVCYILALAFIAFIGWARRRGGARSIGMPDAIPLALAATPLAAYLVRWELGLGGSSTTGWIATFLANVALLVVFARWGATGATAPLRRVLLATLVFFAIDAYFGMPLQFIGVFGSNPALGARYFGLGNPATAVLISAAVLWAALHLDHASQQRLRSGIAQYVQDISFWRAATVLLLVVFVIGMPVLGADVGGLFTGTMVFGGFLYVVLFGRIPWRLVFGMLTFAVVLLVVAAWLDYLRLPEDRSHLGRLASDVMHGGLQPLLDVVTRKIKANLLSYGFPWNISLMFLATVATLQLVKGKMSEYLPLGSPLRVGVIATFFAGLIGFAVNDSGVVLLAMIAIYTVPCVLLEYRSLRRDMYELEGISK